MRDVIAEGSVVLLQGDSITDCGRNRQDPEDLGMGYAMMAAAWFNSIHPERGVTFLNRGIGGNKVRDLRDRWEADCLELQPDLVSILVGINDVWPRFNGGEAIPVEEFESTYRELLLPVRDELGARLVLLEPFLLHSSRELDAWREDLDPKIEAVRRLAREFEALLVPTDGLFARASTRRPPQYWAGDGVHPTPPGHALIARAWLRTVGAL